MVIYLILIFNFNFTHFENDYTIVKKIRKYIYNKF